MKILFILLFTTPLISLAQAENKAGVSEVYASDTIVWFGADFSLFNLCNHRKVGQEEELFVYIKAWKQQYDNISNTKLASLLQRKKVINDKEYTTQLNYSLKDRKWIKGIDKKPRVTPSDIADHIQDYDSEQIEGLGLVFILESFYKAKPTNVFGYFVWFDIESKEILHIYNAKGKPSTGHINSWGVEITWDKSLPASKGMTGYWYQGMLDATLNFTLDFKLAIPKKEKQY
ncbi:MAG: hypothetical protein MK105_03115 [Crocinitomicaceae bacterium]|nr:hypothetical protein [Crocinitomicaceae bacterium]